MKAILISLVLFLLPTLLLAVTPSSAGDFKPCCRDGSSPWASESRDTFKSNPLAGYQGSELPPSTGYNPDHLDKYSNPTMNNIYQGASGSPQANQPEESYPSGDRLRDRQPRFANPEEPQ